MKKTVWISIVLVALSASYLQASVKKDLKISLSEKQVQNLSASGLSLVFYVEIANFSSREYSLSGYSYRFVVMDQEFFRLQVPLDPGIEIQPQGSTLISLPVKITYDHLFNTIEQARGEDFLQCYIMGSFHFSDRGREKGRIPVAFSGAFPVFKTLEAEMLSAVVNDLTIGGADLEVPLVFRNRNDKDITVEIFTYEIKVGARTIEEGRRGEDFLVPGKGEMTLSIPVLVNFFDVGKEIYSFLKQESAPFRVTAEMELVTPWGRLTVPLDIGRTVSLEKSK